MSSNSTGSSVNKWAYVLLLIPLLTVLGNLLVMVSVIRVRSLHSPINYLIFALALADLLVALIVMPFAVYAEIYSGVWGLGELICDVYITLDVTCSTASILILVAITYDRYLAATRPLEYASSRNMNRAILTVIAAWVLAGAIASPMANPEFTIISSIGSFFVPCFITLGLYVRIFSALRERQIYHKRRRTTHDKDEPSRVFWSDTNEDQSPSLSAASNCRNYFSQIAQLNKDCKRKPNNGQHLSTSTRYSSAILPTSATIDIISSAVASPDEIDPGSKLILVGTASTEFEMMCRQANFPVPKFRIDDDQSSCGSECRPSQQLERELSFIDEDTSSDENEDNIRRTLSVQLEHPKSLPVTSTSTNELPRRVSFSIPETSKEPLCHTDQSTSLNSCTGITRSITASDDSQLDEISYRKSKSKLSETSLTLSALSYKNIKLRLKLQGLISKRDKMKKKLVKTQRREKRATKTLAVVLCIFLICWLPFFTVNIVHGICTKLGAKSCEIDFLTFFLTTWLGYMNSFMNPIIYTIFSMDFRQAFKTVLTCSQPIKRK